MEIHDIYCIFALYFRQNLIKENDKSFRNCEKESRRTYD